MFAVITPALMTGAFADRVMFRPYLLFILLWIHLVYYPFCHWIWGAGWMADEGVWDFAGGIVVHCTAGFGALAVVMALPHRKKLEPELRKIVDSFRVYDKVRSVETGALLDDD